MLRYMKAVRGMDYEETPDYDALDAMLEAMQKAGGRAAAAKPSGGAARGAKASTANGKASAAKGAKRKPKTTPEVEVCEVKAKGRAKGKPAVAAEAEASPERPSVRRSRRLSSPSENERSASPVAARRRAGGSRKGKALSPVDDADEDDFFDARQNADSDEDQELEVTKVVAGARKSGRDASGVAGAASKSASRGAAPRQGFLLEVRCAKCSGRDSNVNRCDGASLRLSIAIVGLP